MKYTIGALTLAALAVAAWSYQTGSCPISCILGEGQTASADDSAARSDAPRASCPLTAAQIDAAESGQCPISAAHKGSAQCADKDSAQCADGPCCADGSATIASGSATTQPDAAASVPTTQPEAAPVFRFTMNSLEGEPVNLTRYQGKVVLIVNTASKCGLTPQYKGLQKLHETYGGKGLAVLGFPANEFGRQEPGTNEQIAAFCEQRYGVTFDMFEKVVVKGEGICPLYQYLTEKETNGQFAGAIRWNFDKFLVARDGTVVARFAPKVKPESDQLTKAIEAELAKAVASGQ